MNEKMNEWRGDRFIKVSFTLIKWNNFRALKVAASEVARILSRPLP